MHKELDLALWLHHVCLKGSLQVLVQSESFPRWHRRNRESWWTKAYYESTRWCMSLFHYFPFSWRKSQRPYHGLEDTLKLLRAPCPAHWPQLLFTFFPHWFLAFPCKHSPLTTGPLYLLTLCQEKSPWQLHSSPCTLFRSLLKHHHSRAFLTLWKSSPSPTPLAIPIT